jgi:hypothetical protein
MRENIRVGSVALLDGIGVLAMRLQSLSTRIHCKISAYRLAIRQ